MVCVPAHKNGKMHKLETQACGGNGVVLVKILKINWGLDFLWSKIYYKGMVKERQGKCVMILYHSPSCVIACTGTQNGTDRRSRICIILELIWGLPR